MTRFQLILLDDKHMVLATKEPLKREQAEQARTAFAWWMENGGALVVGDCEIVNREAINIDLDLDATADVRADNTSRAPAMGPGGPAPDTPGPRDNGIRRFIGRKSE